MNTHKQLTTILILLLISTVTICPVYANENTNSNSEKNNIVITNANTNSANISIYTNNESQSKIWVIQPKNTDKNPYDVLSYVGEDAATPNAKTQNSFINPNSFISLLSKSIPTDYADTSDGTQPPQPILPLDPSKNNIKSLETDYTNIGSLQTEIILNAAGFEQPEKNQKTSSVKNHIDQLLSDGFLVKTATYETQETTETYNKIKESILDSSKLPETTKAHVSANTYLLYNNETKKDAIVIQCYLSNENNEIIGTPIIAKTTITESQLEFNTSYQPAEHRTIQNNIAIPTYYPTYIPPYENKQTISQIPIENLDTTDTPVNPNDSYPRKYVFTPVKYYGENTFKGCVAIVIIIGTVLGGYAIYGAYQASTITATGVFATTSVIGLTITIIGTSQHTCFEYYPVDAETQYIDQIRINTETNPNNSITIKPHTLIQLDAFGGFATQTSLTNLEKIWSPTVTHVIRIFHNSNHSKPYTIYGNKFKVIIPNDANIIIDEHNSPSIIQNGERIAQIKKSEHNKIPIIFNKENGTYIYTQQ